MGVDRRPAPTSPARARPAGVEPRSALPDTGTNSADPLTFAEASVAMGALVVLLAVRRR